MSVFKQIGADFDGSSYPIIIGRGLMPAIPALLGEGSSDRKALVVADSFLADTAVKSLSGSLAAAGFQVFVRLMDGGKGRKNVKEVLEIYGILEENDFARDSALIALGGGVIGDLAGFVASTWLRGMRLVHVPTTITGMVDSSLGGKVAINFRRTINAIGSYYHPIGLFIDLDFIDTLPDRDLRAGLAEVIKCGIISDRGFFDYISENVPRLLERNDEALVHCINRSLEIKIDHVTGDIREGGKRLCLNFGHTLGHSIEISTERNHEETYRHGEGVAIGMMAAAWIAERHLGADPGIARRISEVLVKFDLPVHVDCGTIGFDRAELLAACKRNVLKDKKRINRNLRLLLAREIGAVGVYKDVPFELVEGAFDAIVR